MRNRTGMRPAVPATILATLTAMLTACGGGGGSDTPSQATLPANVSLQVPALADLSQSINLSTNVQVQSGLNFSWNFGDGVTVVGPTVQHQYLKPGRYDVVLTLSNRAGESNQYRTKVTIERTAALKSLSCTRSDGHGWCWQGARISDKALLDAYFASESRGWVLTEGGEILRTEDGGATWSARPSPTEGPLLSMAGRGAQDLWVTDWASVWSSTDGGEHWTRVSAAPSRQVALVAYGYGLYGVNTFCSTKFCTTTRTYSADGGKSWIDFDRRTVSVTAAGALWRLEVSGSDAFSGGVPGDKGSVQVSRDAGKTWSTVLVISPERFGSIQIVDDDRIVVRHWTGGPGLPDAGSELWSQTRDGGVTWESCQPTGGAAPCMVPATGTPQGVPWAMVLSQYVVGDPRATAKEIVPGPGRRFSLTRQQLQRSEDQGQHWSRAYGPRGTGRVHDITAQSDKAVLQVRDEGVLRSANAGQDWTRVLAFDGGQALSYAKLQPLRDGVIWLSADGRNWRSSDAGQTWQEVPVADSQWGTYWFTPDEQAGWILSGNRVFKTTDRAASWSLAGVLPDDSYFSTNTGEIRVLSPQRLLFRSDAAIALSEDGGRTWKQVWHAPADFTVMLTSMTSLSTSVLVAVGSANTVLVSEDAGATWRALKTPNAFAQTHWRTVGASDVRSLWIGSDRGELLHTTDGGLSWEAAPSGTGSALGRIHFVDPMTGWIATPEGLLTTGSDG